jgi:hypothetical protein
MAGAGIVEVHMPQMRDPSPRDRALAIAIDSTAGSWRCSGAHRRRELHDWERSRLIELATDLLGGDH